MNRLLVHMLAHPETRREVVRAIAVMLREKAERERRLAQLRSIRSEAPVK